jgi:hypothetical protein
MKGFFLGLVFATVGWLGAYFYYVLRPVPAPPQTAVAPAPEPLNQKRARRVKRRGRSVAANVPGAEAAAAAPEAPERKLTAAELKQTSRGEDLSRPDVVHLDMAGPDTAEELSQEDIDDRFRARQEAILECIDKARPDPSTFVSGRVNIQFRIQRTGQIRGVRVEAPAILQQGGLYGCVKDIVMGLRYPASSGSQVVTYPFELS